MSERKTWRDMIGQDWRIRADPERNEAEILMPDERNRGSMIGPLATVPLGETRENPEEESETVACLDWDDGRNLYAIAALPHVAELLCWIEDELEKSVSLSDVSAFRNALRDRLTRLLNRVDRREAFLGEGTFSVE